MATVVKEAAAPAGEYQLVPIGVVEVDKGFNNRRSLGDITELADSIRSVGLLQPLLVWKRPINGAVTEPKGYLHVIAGHRRLAASKQAGLTQVPVIVVQQDEKLRMESLLVENLPRLDLDPLEEADGYKRLLELGLKQQDIAAKVGRSPAHVSKRLSLLELPDEVHQLVLSGKLHLVDALELLPYVKEPEIILETLKNLRESIKHGWGFRVEDHARGAKRRVEAARKQKAAVEKLTAEKVSIIKTTSPWNLTKLGHGYNHLPMTATAHSKSPCHAAFVDAEGAIEYICTTPANHKTSEDKTVAKAARSLTAPASSGGNSSTKAPAKKAAESRERNKVLRIREPLRTAELKRVITARQKREDVLDFVLRQLLQRFIDESDDVAELAAQILEVPMGKKPQYGHADPDFATWLSAGNSDRVFRLAYVLALASGELPFRTLVSKGFFSEEFSANAARYLEHLEANGYKPDKVEVAQLAPVNKYRWRAPFDKVKPKGKEKK
jgi:ParB/RepB/Spo0J family partition protein